MITQDSIRELDIAVVGMSGRFPGARNIEEFWHNLRTGVESISFPSEQQLEQMGVPLATIRRPGFVNAAPLLAGVDLFDAEFFGYSPREAEIMDPQHRIFLECAWESLECAGYRSDEWPGLVGVYAGTSMSSYLIYNLLGRTADPNSDENLELMIGNDKDFLSTRVAYKLNLTGPAITVQTGCSSSLVAIHLACQALLNCHCDMALAGGVSVHVPQRAGYYAQENGVTSRDGHCRPFDALADGTLFGSGVGVVVLKRLADAIADRDTIHATIRGSAINNDGSQKVGYTAPSVEGQRSVILTAHAIAGVDPDTISYVECHGTATALGDPVEVQALTRAFAARTSRKGFCGLGSVKSNIGHLDAAAGVAGFIKTVLALKHKILPPSLHFESPNPKIDLQNSPFYVNHSLNEWKHDSRPLRAAVSSFGIGGTNAHVVLEEAQAMPPSGTSREFQLIPLSAKTPTALESTTVRLANHLRNHPEVHLADVAYTLSVGRKSFQFRRVAICADREAVQALEKLDPADVFTSQNNSTSSSVAFMFPGGGSQYPNMGRDLYRSEETFQQGVDRCAKLLLPKLEFDIRHYLFPSSENLVIATARIKEPLVGLTALFVIEFALAQLWMSWGIKPEALIGYSLGEYTAACVAGVFSLEDALDMVVVRGKLFASLSPGAMTAIPLSEKELTPILGANLSIAAINAEDQCVVSGPKEEVDRLIASLSKHDVECRRVQVAGAGHCAMVEQILGPFRDFLKTIRFHPPRLPYLSNLTGSWITATQAMDPEYWIEQLRRPVLFGAGVKELLNHPHRILVEVGPGRTLTSIAMLQGKAQKSHIALPSIRHPYDHQSDVKFLLRTLGRLWLVGAAVNWHNFYANESRVRTPLPPYPFEHRRYWIDSNTSDSRQNARLEKVWNLDEWFHVPSWQELPLDCSHRRGESGQFWLVLAADEELSSRLIQRLTEKTPNVVTVRAKKAFRRINSSQYEMNLSVADHYVQLLDSLCADRIKPHNILHLWSLDRLDSDLPKSTDQIQERGTYSLVLLAKALAQGDHDYQVCISIISSGMFQVESSDVAIPERITMLAPSTVIPQEDEHICCRNIDVNVETASIETVCDQILQELESRVIGTVAYRGTRRWVRGFKQIRLGEALDTSKLLENGTYIITGGLGNIGLQLAARVADANGAKIALLTRSGFPSRQEWPIWLESGEDQATCRRIRRLMDIESKGAELMVLSADVADFVQMQHAINQVQDRWGRITGVIHLAGITGESAMNMICDLGIQEFEQQFRPKISGLKVLEALIAPLAPRFCVLFSSTAAVLGGIGSVAYSAANLFMDAFAETRPAGTGRTRWISVNWDGWLLDGEERSHSSLHTSLDRYSMTAEESWQCFGRIVAGSSRGQIVVSTGELSLRQRLWLNRNANHGSEHSASATCGETQERGRPVLGTPYVPGSNDLENMVLAVWQKTLGISEIGVCDNFFDLGGNSLLGVRMIAELRKTLNLEIPLISLFQGPTVRALCGVIECKKKPTASLDESRVRGLRRRQNHVENDVTTVVKPSRTADSFPI